MKIPGAGGRTLPDDSFMIHLDFSWPLHENGLILYVIFGYQKESY